jgi:hypothetical protein
MMRDRLRAMLYITLKRYSNGKTMHSWGYGIDWDACCRKLRDTEPADIREKKYHVDHIIAVSRYDLTDPEQVRQAFSPENLQWLTAEENWKKNNKLV